MQHSISFNMRTIRTSFLVAESFLRTIDICFLNDIAGIIVK